MRCSKKAMAVAAALPGLLKKLDRLAVYAMALWLTHLVDTPRSAFSSLSLRERAGGEGSYFSHCSNFKSKVKSHPLTPTLSPKGGEGERGQTALLWRVTYRP